MTIVPTPIRRLAASAGLLALLVLAGPPVAGAAGGRGSNDGRWLHIRVQETRGDEETVHVNLPLSLVDAVLPLIDADNLRNGKLRVGHGMHLRVNEDEIDAARLREIWAAVRTARDGEYITVQGKKDNVRVAKQAGMMIVKATEDDGDHVDLRVPVPVVEALLSGKTDELDLRAAIQALGTHGDLQLTAVDEDSSLVRIWVDDRNLSD